MSEAARVLVVEDDEVIRSSVAGALRDAGLDVLDAPDGRRLEEVLERWRPAVVVLDWMLPGRDGPALARVVRSRASAGIVMVTARETVPDRLEGFDAGADDYLPKPFAMAELVARVTAVLRRVGAVPAVLRVGDLGVDEAAARVWRGDVEIDLTATELRLLVYLAQNRDRVLSPTQILTQVWGYGDYADNLVQVHVSAVRRKLEEHGERLLHTVRGLGYVLRAPS